MNHDDLSDLLVAEVAERWIAFPARRIERVLPALPACGEFPCLAPGPRNPMSRKKPPPWILGLSTLDARVLTLLDPAALLDRSGSLVRKTPAVLKKTLVVDSGPYRFGLVVDEVIGIRSGSPEAANDDPAPTPSESIVSMTLRIDSKSAWLVDIDALCSTTQREAA